MPEECDVLQIGFANRKLVQTQLTQEDHILSGGRVSDVVGNLIERNKKIQRSKDLL